MIGLIVAMRREARPLRRAGVPPGCTLVLCGIGLQSAKAATEKFMETQAPSLLISFGISGGVEEDLEAGDVVVPGSVRLLGSGAELPLAPLSPAAFQAVQAAVAARGSRAYRGSLITTSGQSVPSAHAKGMNHPVLDMETFAIAEAAARHNVPLISVRALSDSLREPLPFDLQAMTDARGRFRMGRLVGQVMRRPEILRRLPRLQENTRRAEENVIAAVVALLSSLRPS